MKPIEKITPLFATHPGEVLFDELEANEISQVEFSSQIGIKKSQLNEIIKGKRNINADQAILFEKVLGIDAEYWLELQKNYNLDKAKILAKNQKRLEAIEQWNFIKDYIATKFLRKEKIITNDPLIDIPKIKDIYNVASFEALANVNAQPNYVRFRKSNNLNVNRINLIAWVKLTKYKASKVIVGKFDYEKKDELLVKLKVILLENTNTKIRIEKLLSDYGIKIIFQSKGEKTPVDGISFWSNGNPAIGMSLRYKRLDYFSFTLMHEIGHIYEHLLNNNNAEYIDIEPKFEHHNYINSKEEKEANYFASNQLIPENFWNNFIKNHNSIYKFNDKKIFDFADKVGVNPAIIKGRLCNYFNNYKLKSNIINEIN